MPILTINTNIGPEKVPAGFLSKATDLIAEILSKPTSYVAVHINTNQQLQFGKSDEPAALCDLVSIGALGSDVNKKHSKAIMNLLSSELQISPKKTYISFKNEDKANVGYASTTFADLI